MAEDARHLARYRPYLHLLARWQVEPGLQAKVDLSGVVQQTLLEAAGAWPRLAGLPSGTRLAWLRQALAHNLTDEVRKWRAGKRAADLERSLDASSARLEAWLAADQSSPSERAEKQEDLVRLAAALARLPEDQRLAVELHHLQNLPLADLAARLGRTKGAVAALLYRALGRLRELLTADEGGDADA
jgi:RNA polymerase sigma-70 factor (ECF subfamily)